MARKRSSLGFLFWTACILLVLVVFLFSKSTIDRVLESTGFLTVFRNRFNIEGSPEVHRAPLQENGSSSNSGNNQPDAVLRVEPIPPVIPDRPAPAPISREVPAPSPAPAPGPAPAPSGTAADPAASSRPEAGPAIASRPEPEKRLLRKSKLYFVSVDDEGRINLKSVARPVYYIDSPLTATLNALLQGPTAEELNAGLLTLIPQNTELVSAYIKGTTVFLNFSETFRFNSLGMDGYVAQLKQIVYVATEFSTVKDVQFLIQGKQLDYLSAEGIYIGAPLSRAAF